MMARNTYTAVEVLELLNAEDGCESDGGDFPSLTSDSEDSDVELRLQLSTDADEKDTPEEQSSSPPAKRKMPASIKAKDGTLWDKINTECLEDTCSSAANAFSDTEGPTSHAKRRIRTRLQSFLCLVDIEMLMIITDCTLHAARKVEPSWMFSVSELMAFLAILFFRATVCQVGAMTETWSKTFAVPLVKETMSRDRYQDIMHFLRIDIKDTRPERVKTDRFAAISNIWQRFVTNCIRSYNPGKHITVDEQLFPTKVRCPFLQYIATKPDKFGIKFWIAADLKTKYMCNAFPYLGKDPSRPKGESLSESIVMKLMEPFMNKGRTVTTDNVFTSLSLANRLLKFNTTLLGAMNTIRRELPPPAKNAKGREKFSTDVYKSGNATLTVYAPKINKTVCVLSTTHQQVQISAGHKRKPKTILDYNHTKCGVDIMDQKARIYSVRAGTRRWPVAVSYNMLDLAVMNAHILHQTCTRSTESRREFVYHLAKELRHRFQQEKELKKQQRPPTPSGKKTQCQVQTHCNRNHSSEQCAVCHQYTCRKGRKDSPWVCAKC